MANKIKLYESDEQIWLFQWAAYNEHKYPELEFMFHIPNGGHRTKTTAARLKREGVRKGVPDICLPAPRGKHHGLYIEMKVDSNKPSPEQERYIAYLKSQSYCVQVCYGFDSAINIIVKYLELECEEL